MPATSRTVRAERCSCRRQAGVGDLVLILEEGGAAREVMKRPGGAVDAVIVGVVDHLDSNEGFFNRGNIS